MTQAERLKNKDYYFEFRGVAMHGDYTKFDWSGQAKAVDLTANGDAAEFEEPGTKRYDPSFEAFYRGAAGTAITAELREGLKGTVTWGPEGTAAGKPKGQLAVFVKQFDHKSGSRDQGQTISVTFGPQGDLIKDPRVDVWP